MNNPWDDIRAAINEAKAANQAVADHASSMASLLRGNLRRVGPYHLAELKRELRGFNIQTKKWEK